MKYMYLVHVRDDAVRYQLAVLGPVLAVLGPACRLVPSLPVQQQCGKVEAVEVGHDGEESGQASGQAPG